MTIWRQSIHPQNPPESQNHSHRCHKPRPLQSEIPYDKQPQPKTLLPPHPLVQPVSHQKIRSQQRSQPRPSTTKDPRPKRPQPAAPMKPILALPESWSTIPNPWSPLKSCHDTQKQTTPPRATRQRASL